MAGSCVRVDPPLVQFSDVSVGQVFKIKITVENVGKTSKKIMMGKPGLKLFKFTASSSAVMVAPGLSVSGLLEFIPEKEEEVRDRLLVHVDNTEIIEVPLLGCPKTCSFLMDSVVDFGCIAANSQVITKYHSITNEGSAPGLFQVHYNGEPSVSLSPCTGVIRPRTTQWLRVELRTDKPRLIDECAEVKLLNRSAVLSIRAEVVDQCLEVFDTQGAPLSCLCFGPVYFGTSSVEKVVLRNNGPQACDWVCLLQHNAAGTESGIDLQKNTDVTLLDRMERCSSFNQDISEVLVCVPEEGRLGPYEKTTVTILFSPRNKRENWKSLAGRQDYCLFVLFESIERKHGFTHPNGKSSVELAVTGTGLPVVLVPRPSHHFDFQTCVQGQCVDLHCVLQNFCLQLPITFCFHKLAHFKAKPSAGTIPPGGCQDIVLSFNARQQGNFHVRQKLNVLGHVVQKDGQHADDVTALELCSFHTITLHLSAVCLNETIQPAPKLNPGITPLLTNPTGPQPDVPFRELARCRAMAQAAVLFFDKTRLHEHRRRRNIEEEEFVAFPNDRATSTRPATAKKQYRTVFTGVQRYCYLDTTYSFTEEEEKQRQQHKQIYINFLKQLRQTRLQTIKEKKHDKTADVDIGMITFHGLVPPAPRISELEISANSETTQNYRHPFQALGQSRRGVTSLTPQVPEGMNAVPSNKQEVADCAKTLTAQELYQVDIGPLFVDFGEVCVQSVCVQKLELTNHLSAFVWVQLEVDCPELQGSSPLSHVLPPQSLSSLRLMFQSNKLGPFYRPMSYSVNQQHNGQIVVQAQVVPLALELSTTLLVLRQIPNLLAQSEYRSSVAIKNQCNQVAEFTWRPVVTQSGNPFSIRPATGRVEPYSELVCEVVWHPSFSSPQQGDFDLLVHEGNTQRLHCVAKVGATSVQLPEKQVMFKLVPLNMCSTRTALLYNAGQNHAYYKVRDFCPLPGLVVSPSEGVVPSGGNTLLSINFNPDSIISFDTRIEIALKDMKSLELRVIGSVEPPNVDMSVSLFQFSGVYAGSRGTIPFSVTNYSAAAARVAFDFSEYTDFSLQLPQPAAVIEEKPGMHIVEIQSKATVECCLIFSPTQDSCYDFEMPVTVNGVRWPTASLSPLLTPSSSSTTLALPSAGSRKHLMKRLSVTMATPQSQRIQAAVLCAPLQMSPSRLQFYVEHFKLQSDDYSINKTVMLKAVCEKSVYWRSGVKEQVNWWFDCSAMVASTEDNSDLELCAVSPSSGGLGPGQSVCVEVSIRPETIRKASGQVTTISLPLYLRGEGIKGEKGDGPYRELSITITLRSPCITFHPPQILLTPVPLESEVTATLTLLALGYSSGTTVSAEVDEVELEDGTKIQPVSVVFPDGNIISAPQQDERYPVSIPNKEAKTTALMCSVSFCSARPVSVCTNINFADHLDNKFKVKVYASADSCLLTVWPFMALHRSEQKIVLQPGMTTVEAIPQGQRSSTAVSILTSSSTSLFNFSSSVTSDSVSDSYEGGECLSDQARRHSICSNGHTPTNLGLPEFPPAISQEGLYRQKVLLAVERWFSFFGWPGGPHPISVPHTLRRLVSERLVKFSSGQCQRVTLNRDCRSVVDMLHHLTGQHIPGIPRCYTFSNDIAQRTHQLLQQHEAMLAFLRVQGAFLCHIRPEFLLDIQEFKHWCSLQSNEKVHGLDYSSVDYESLSKGSWTDVLLQIYRVLVLSRVSRRGLDKSLEQGNMNGILPFSSQSLTSNIYSGMELQLLSWVNMHYQSSREAVWGTDGAPSARWIVNFDLDFKDGLVLAALLAAYCPFLIQSHFQRMYTEPSSLEQVLHNNIIVFEALITLHLNLDVQPTDLSNPNPVQILMLCVHLYERLPQYLPLHTIELSGDLHTMFSKQVRLKNPSPKPVKYQACLFGENAHRFSLPNGSTVTIPSRSSTELNVLYYCSFMQSMEAVLLLISGSPFGLQGRTLTFRLKTRISHITPTNTVRCKSPCYQMKMIQVPITNPFKKEAKFRVVLVESEFNPLEPKKKKVRLVHNSSETNPEAMTLNKTCGEDLAENCSNINGEANDFCCAVRSVCLTPSQEKNLEIHYLPFSLGTKYCSVLLVCPQVGDIVYMIEATAELPLPSPLTARPSDNIVIVPNSPVLSIHCRIWQVCEEMVYVPLNNVAWENALAIWGQYSMSADEHRRRMLTNSLHSSAVRANTAASKLLIQQTRVLRGDQPNKGVEYTVEVSLPQYFALPSVVNIHVNEDNISWQNTADHCYVGIPLRFQADSVGRFKCQMVLSSWSDTRVYEMEALVTSEEESVHLNFSSPIYQSVTQDIPLYNDTRQDWKMQAVVCGEGFSGPEVVIVPAGTKTYYPLTFNPSAQCVVMGKLSLHNECYGTKSLFILRGVGEHPLPVDHVVLHCPVGQTTRTQLDVPNYSQKTLTLKVETDLSTVSGTPFLEIKPGHTAPYTLSVTPWKRGKETGCVSFHETDGIQETDKDKGDILRHYKVFFSLEIICEPAAPVGVINVQCASLSLVDIEIPVNNPRNEQLMLDVYLEGDNLTGANCVLIPALETLTYKATYSPGSVGKTTGSVLFYSELVGEFWYELALYALPPPVLTLPLICCPLGKLTTQAIPLVNPTEETVKLLVTNSNPRHYTVEMTSGNTLVVEPHSSTQVAVHFRPSSIGEEKHTAKITFKGPEFQEWCVFLTGRGLNPEGEEPVSISSLIGTSTSIAIPFTNPTEFPVILGVTLTDEDPLGGTSCHQVTTDKEVFSIPLHHTEGILINKGASFDVPVVFAPNSMGLKHIWLCITMKPVSSNNAFSTDGVRPEQELSTICWIYHVCGIPMEVSVENSALGVIQCEAGHQLEKTMDILLAGYVPRNHDKMGHEVFQVSAEDFVCSIHSDNKAEVEDWLSAFVKAGRRDPETGLIILTLNVAFTPPKQCRRSVFLVVQCASGMIWQFPFKLSATKPYMDDVIVIDATEVGKTSSVGFHLTSTTRRSEPFTAAFLPGSSSEFTVTPASGILPPVSSAGKLITVSFTPTTHSRHRARLTIQAADMQCIYEVKGETLHEFSPLCSTSTDCSSNVLRPGRGKTL